MWMICASLEGIKAANVSSTELDIFKGEDCSFGRTNNVWMDHRLNMVFVIWRSVQVLVEQAQGMLGEAVQSEATAIINMINLQVHSYIYNEM
jgi:hypothetical protein